jgi:hydroxymethylpyrimidine/phosphomethylpyrimidine kinase
MTPVALSIAGSDPSGGAGIQADLKTFHRLGVYGEAVVTLITVQNTLGTRRMEILDPSLIAEQIEAVITDIPPLAAKTGALGNHSVVEAVAKAAESFSFPLIVDPVMIGKGGAELLDVSARRAFVERLIPRAFLLTPNLPEAAELAGFPVHDLASMARAARTLIALGAANVLVKGGHLKGNPVDLLLTGSGEWLEYPAARISTVHTHGTGCTYSAAITAELARGFDLKDAIGLAKKFVSAAIRTNPGLGRGAGPLNHFAGQ